MSYEWQIASRYLYAGSSERATVFGAVASLMIAAFGLAILVLTGGGSVVGVILFVLGLLSAAVFLLLAFMSVPTSVSVFGVSLGVAALTVVLSVTSGFQDQFREKVLGVNAHVIIMKSSTDFAEYREVMETARKIDPDVVAVQPFIFAEMLATTGKGRIAGVAVKGVDPQQVRGVLDLEKHMVEGSVAALATAPPEGALPPIIIGKELARKLRIKSGDTVTVVVPMSNVDLNTWRTTAAAPRTRRFEVAGIFYSGFEEYDRRLMYTSLAETQVLLDRGDKVMGVELKVKDVERASIIAGKLRKRLGEPPFQVQDWYELNQNLFMALTMQKIALLVVLTLIIAVATVNVISAMVMMVTQKKREIAMLKSMGAPSFELGWVFAIVGTAIGAVGTVIGIGLGVATCLVVRAYGYPLDPKVYLIDRLPISVHPLEVAMVAGVTMVLCVTAALIPALKAASLRPVEGLRDE
ncbi:MAG: ABC transporter permease [Kofleriaceae bacterium]|nr:ABC transporter permease [Kofleriaceae bacterium]MCL4224764.1 ABC transporter permease [Myxococcales bacterium]